MVQIRNWQSMKERAAHLLKERTGLDVTAWNQRIQTQNFGNERALRAWLNRQGVTSYAQNLLVWERFGYPDFMQASAEELIQGQYADRPQLQLIFEAILGAVAGWEDIIIQARKTYVSLRTSRRTFARVQATTKQRVDLALRLEGQKPGRRLQPSRIHETTHLQVSLTTAEDVDAEVLDWLRKAYDQNR